jgi:hypothetical protein
MHEQQQDTITNVSQVQTIRLLQYCLYLDDQQRLLDR